MKADLHHLLAEYPLETLLQTIPTGLFLIDNDLQIVYWNREAERITGYTAEEAIGRHCSFLEGHPCIDKCGLYDVTNLKPVIGIGCTLQHKSGHRIELSKNVDLLRNKSGEVIGGIEAFVDITRLKKLENRLRLAVDERTQELELEKAGLRSVLDGMTDPVYIGDTNYQITFTNRAMQEIFGHVVGQHCYEVFYHESQPCEGCPLPETLTGQVVRRERTLKETGRTYEIIHSPYPKADRPTHKLAAFRDITERKEAERRLQQANRELDAFVSTVSHDLRSPLTPLIGFAELMEDRYQEQLDDLGRECLSEIKKTGAKMKALLEDLLVLARVGQLKSPSHPINMNQVAEDSLAEVADKVLERQARVGMSDLPCICIPEPLLCDLIHNLLGNALKYAVEEDPNIEICGEKLPGKVRYQVVDHGPGIPDDEKEEIFEPFRRGSTSGKKLGTGIGLATVAKIARVYQGDAWVEDTPGGGATFVVEFPDNCPDAE